MFDQKPVAVMKNWKIENQRVHGNVYEHPRHVDGYFVTTSTIVNLKGNRCETLNTIYILE